MVKKIIRFLRKHISYSPSSIFRDEVGKLFKVNSPSESFKELSKDVGLFFEVGMQLGEKDIEIQKLKNELTIQKSIKRHYKKRLKKVK